MISATDSGEQVRVADFSELKEPGRHRLLSWTACCIVALKRSFGPDVFVKALMESHGRPLRPALRRRGGGPLGRGPLQARRVSSRGRERGPGGGEPTQDASKGWHDAGDYGKYVNNGAFSLGMTLQAFE